MIENSKQNKVDTLYSSTKSDLRPFQFNQAVVYVFPDMINRSVPSYQLIIDGIGAISAKYMTDGCRVYDLGCSLGSATLSVAKHNQGKQIHIDAIDNSAAMVERCAQHISAFNFDASIDVHKGDITAIDYHPCRLIVMNFTLQFISPEQRQELINKLYKALEPGGLLIVSEKITDKDDTLNDLLSSLHLDFKRDNGYSELEISQKRSALENVMILDSIDCHHQRFENAGFASSTVWFQHFNFVSFCAYKKSESET